MRRLRGGWLELEIVVLFVAVVVVARITQVLGRLGVGSSARRNRLDSRVHHAVVVGALQSIRVARPQWLAVWGRLGRRRA